MLILSCDHLSLSFGGAEILSDVTFRLNEGDRLGIVGVNGAGKSSLFRILTGSYLPDTGTVAIARGKTVGILEQDAGLDSSREIFQEMLLAFPNLLEQERELQKMMLALQRVDHSPEDASGNAAGLAKCYAEREEAFRESGGYTFRDRIRSVLTRMGFPEELQNLPISTLSGGQKTRLALVRLLLSEPDLLLLDEPTNHLDIETMEWLEGFLSGYRKTLLVISHDRFFLDRVTNHTLEIENGKSRFFEGNYTRYQEQKAIDRELEERRYANQQKEIARIEAYIAQQKRWNRERNIIAAESRQKQLDKIERLEKPKEAPQSIRIRFEKSGESGNEVLTLSHLSKSYPGKQLFSDVSATIGKHDAVFVYGPNGCGKSTLMKILVGKVQPDSGSFEFGYNVSVGYYDQEQQELNEKNTVLEELWSEYESRTQTEIRNALALFQFRGEDIEKKVSVLSGGEKARLTFAKLILSKMNLLLLDEPTNHLDIPSREALEHALSSFDGTIVAVSHDRYFIQKLANRIFDLREHRLFDFRGNYESYLEYRSQHMTEERDTKNEAALPSAGKEQYLKSKAETAQKRREERQRNQVRDSIRSAEDRITEIGEEMAGSAASDYVRLSALQSELDALEEKLLFLYEEEERMGPEPNS
ncbi:MAG: ABC-F family ATP-binding cassette domain-containing protein [Clostridia bacterium]|nr:ABC-F family ATP-binding cassette domain-containing protein [Clostridia bacterium]